MGVGVSTFNQQQKPMTVIHVIKIAGNRGPPEKTSGRRVFGCAGWRGGGSVGVFASLFLPLCPLRSSQLPEKPLEAKYKT